MSRIGKNPIAIPAGVDVAIDDQNVTVKGPKGTLSHVVAEPITAKIEDGQVVVERPNDERTSRSLHGLSRTLIANMIIGVTEGYKKDLEITGTGYRVVAKGKDLEFSLGFSHTITVTPPEGIDPVAFIPDFELRTAAARAALPATVPHGDASFNVARGALLASILSGGAQASGGVNLHALIMEATRDRLHQEQRRAAMEPSLALVDWLRGAGFAAVVSGAGPTVLSLEQVGADIRRDAAGAGWRVVPLAVAASGVQITRGSLAKVEF